MSLLGLLCSLVALTIVVIDSSAIIMKREDMYDGHHLLALGATTPTVAAIRRVRSPLLLILELVVQQE